MVWAIFTNLCTVPRGRTEAGESLLRCAVGGLQTECVLDLHTGLLDIPCQCLFHRLTVVRVLLGSNNLLLLDRFLLSFETLDGVAGLEQTLKALGVSHGATLASALVLA